LIHPKKFAEANQILEQRSENLGHGAASGPDYIATGRPTCPKCGKPMIGTRANGKTKTYRYYTCWNLSRHGKAKCDMALLNADAIDQALVDAVASFYRSQHILISEAVDAARSQHESSHVAVNAELKVIHVEIAKVTGKIHKYPDALRGRRARP
jgi:site-specific DNA recombinase